MILTQEMEDEYERQFIEWKRLHSERPNERLVATPLEGTVSETESCRRDERGGYVFSLKQYRALRFWFFKEANLLSYRACDRAPLKPGSPVRLLVWQRVDALSPICFVQCVDLRGRAPAKIGMIITYSDGTERRIRTRDPITVLELMAFMAEHAKNQCLRNELALEISKRCRACGGEATTLCAECGAPKCDNGKCEHRHVTNVKPKIG